MIVDRAKWFRETEISDADSERTVQQPGAAAYGRRKAVMYRNLADDASKVYADANEEADKVDMKARQP
jgi:hypothetical protein